MKTRITLACVATLAILGMTQLAQAVTLPTVTSATRTYHIDAHDMNNDGGATNPGDGNNISSWSELTTGASLNIQSTPSWQATAISGGPAVRFDGGPAGGDLVFSNNAAIVNTSAQTIYGVARMTADAHVLSNLVSNSGGVETIRQTTAETAAYFTGNGADFHFGGTFNINGNQQFAIPGGFGAAHAVRSISPSAVNINSLRIGDNANNRLWSGDVAEIIVYNARLSGDDTIAVQGYLSDKYGIAFTPQFDDRLNESKQIAVEQGNKHVAANFHYGTPGEVSGTFKGIEIANIDLTGAVPPSGPFELPISSGPGSATLTLDMPFTSDNSQRVQNASITGTDAAVLNTVANEFFYLSNAGNHPSAGMLFEGLPGDANVFVQVLGGDAGWDGDIQVTANGGTPIDWLGVSDGGGAGTASLFGFYATTNSLGQLDLDFTVPSGNFAGIGGIVVSFTTAPEPSTLLLAAFGVVGLMCGRRRRNRNAY